MSGKSIAGETIEVISRLQAEFEHEQEPLPSLEAFPRTALMLDTSQPHAAILRIGSIQRMTSLHNGVLQLAAQMHGDAPQFLGDGGPVLWYALLYELRREAVPHSAHHLPLHALRALAHLLRQDGAPAAAAHTMQVAH